MGPVSHRHLISLRTDGGPNSDPLGCAGRKAGTITLARAASRRAQAQIRYNHDGSRPLMASSGLLSHSSSCLLIAHVAPLCNSSSNPERALREGRFHAIIFRDFRVKSTPSIHPDRLANLGVLHQPNLARLNVGLTSLSLHCHCSCCNQA
jgi:hypothetical protein